MTEQRHMNGMGSFTAKPQQEREECEGDKAEIPSEVAAGSPLLQWVRQPLAHLPPLLPRLYRTPAPHAHTTPAPRPPPALPSSFRVMQWNILAQALGTHADNFTLCPVEALSWDTRKFRILEEILVHLPHVVCLQEVDHFDFLEKVLARQGYKGLFMPKPDSPCIYLPNNNGPDGCAVFWDVDKFDLIKEETRVVEVWRVQSNQVAILLMLEEKSSGNRLVILTTHLKARQGALLSALRNEQGKDLLTFLDTHRNGAPAVVCGDFNAEPSEPVYTTMTDDNTPLQSSYADVNGGKEPDYSTWKVRGETDYCHNLDYIFYTPESLVIDGVVDAPKEEDLGPSRAPSLAYPSDHFSLICDLSFAKAEERTKADSDAKEIENSR